MTPPTEATATGLKEAIARDPSRLKYYPDYIDDPDGLERFRQAVLTNSGHDMAAVNHNSLGRLIDTIERLRRERDAALLPSALVGCPECGFNTCMCDDSPNNPDTETDHHLAWRLDRIRDDCDQLTESDRGFLIKAASALRTPSASVGGEREAIEAGRVVLEGRGDGTYAEAERAIRLLITSLAAPETPPTENLIQVAERILERGYVSSSIAEERDDHNALVQAIANARGAA